MRAEEEEPRDPRATGLGLVAADIADAPLALGRVAAGIADTGTALSLVAADAATALDLVAVDTAVASRFFAADPAPGRLAGRTVVLPFTTVAELATWPERLLWGHSRTEELCRWIDSGRMILGDDTVARIWGRITVAAQRAGSVAAVNDAWVAAGCLSYGLPLATLNAHSYQYFADRYGLELL